MKTYLAKTLAVLAVLATTTVTVVGGVRSTIAAPFNPDNLTDHGAPESTAGGGTRGCPAVNNQTKSASIGSLTVLTPENLKLASNQVVLSLTVQPHPEFFWYVPETTAQEIEFALSDENGNPVYQTRLAVPETEGIMSVSLPQEEEYALQEGSRYYWVVSLICDRSADPLAATGYPYADGWIERLATDSDLARQVAQSQDHNDYAAAGIWQEALAYLARQHRANPSNSAIARDWQEFLESVDLGQFANVEFVSSQPLNHVASDSLVQ